MKGCKIERYGEFLSSDRVIEQMLSLRVINKEKSDRKPICLSPFISTYLTVNVNISLIKEFELLYERINVAMNDYSRNLINLHITEYRLKYYKFMLSILHVLIYFAIIYIDR